MVVVEKSIVGTMQGDLSSCTAVQAHSLERTLIETMATCVLESILSTPPLMHHSGAIWS